MSVVWITRAQPGADQTAARVREMGHEPLISPVLAVRALDCAIDMTGVGALALTSANGVRAFASGLAGTLPVFVIGEATAAAARLAGVEDGRLRISRGDVAALADLIAQVSPPGAVLCPGAREPAADLPALLAARGVQARAAIVYKTLGREPAEALARLNDITAVLIHSPRAASRVAEVLGDHRPDWPFFCISPQAAAPLVTAGHQKVFSAPFPDEPGLLKLLTDR